jgi:hypothetical protein
MTVSQNRNAADTTQFDSQAAVTRSMLGWGVLAGPVYLLVGLGLALTRDGFDLSRHQLSLLMLGEHGWVQKSNLIVSGVLVLIAALGAHRAMNREAPHRATAVLVGIFGLGLVGSGLFPPDPMAGFPAGADAEVTASGMLHLAFGLVQFVALAAAAVAAARWMAARADRSAARSSRIAAAVILVGFLGGAALAQRAVGVLLLWICVVACYAWLAAMSVYLWRTVPNPDADRRTAQ